jgi:prepilin-type processing-associated H-X9-DG protein
MAPKNGYAISNYVGFAGIGKDGPALPANSPKAGIFAYNRKTRVADITDGTSNTMAVTETKTNTGPWGAAGSSTMRPATQQPYVNGPDGFGGITPQGMNVLFADGSVRFISKDIDPKVFEAMITIHGGEAINPNPNP